jgi:pimeloyl-ACP methyl ester carboxylesterase
MTVIKNITKRLTLASVKGYLNTLTTVSPEKGGEKAFKLFSKPRKGRLTSTNKAFLNSAIWETVEFQNFKIQTYRWVADDSGFSTKNGPFSTILLAHGWESNSARWKPILAKLLKQGHTVVALDAPAHGATSGKLFIPIEYAACINKVIAHFQPSILVGHSVGGYASAYCMAHFTPPSVKKLILMATPSNMTQIFDAFLDFLKLSDKTRQAFYDYIKTEYGKPAEAFALEHFADKIKAQGLIIHDENDEIIPHKDAFTIEKAWKTAKVNITQGQGHRLRHEKIYKMILDFVK